MRQTATTLVDWANNSRRWINFSLSLKSICFHVMLFLFLISFQIVLTFIITIKSTTTANSKMYRMSNIILTIKIRYFFIVYKLCKQWIKLIKRAFSLVTGKIKTSAVLDAESKSGYWLTVFAQDHGIVPLHSQLEASVNIILLLICSN